MIKPLYTIRDTMIQYYEPCCFINEDVAKREFINAYNKHPNKDYMQLWSIGTFDTETGTIIGITPELIMKGADF